MLWGAYNSTHNRHLIHFISSDPNSSLKGWYDYPSVTDEEIEARDVKGPPKDSQLGNCRAGS